MVRSHARLTQFTTEGKGETMRQAVFVLALCVTFLIGSSFNAGAVSNMTVVIQGQTEVNSNCPAAPAPCEIVISANSPPGPGARSYSGITISGLDGVNPAKVRAIDDNTNDTLELVNAKITATADGLNGDISFWSRFDAGPKTAATPPPPTKVNFARTETGSMRRGANAAKDNWFKVTGWVNDNDTGDNEIATYSQKTVCCSVPSSYGNINCPSMCLSEEWTDGLQYQRVIKTQFWFYQKYVSDLLNLTSVQIYSTTVTPSDFSHVGVFDGHSEEFLADQDETGKKKGKDKKQK